MRRPREPGVTAAAADRSTDGQAQRDWMEIVATVLLAFAAVATAWSSYQANRWNGETTKAASRVNALRIDAARAQGLAEGQTQVDIGMFFQWVNANAAGDQELEDFYAERFRPEFRPAFDAWLATDPLTNTDSPPTPFAMDEYQLEARDRSRAARCRGGGDGRRRYAATSNGRPTTSSASCCSPSPCSSPASAPSCAARGRGRCCSLSAASCSSAPRRGSLTFPISLSV